MERKEITLSKLQKAVQSVEYKSRSMDKYMLKLMEEVGELAEAVRKEKRLEEDLQIKGTIEEELVDCLYYIACLANVSNIDLTACSYLKEEINAKKYERQNMYESNLE